MDETQIIKNRNFSIFFGDFRRFWIFSGTILFLEDSNFLLQWINIIYLVILTFIYCITEFSASVAEAFFNVNEDSLSYSCNDYL